MMLMRHRVSPLRHLLFALLLLPLGLGAQTVIDLGSGGVRAKTLDDYREERADHARQQADSLAYIDHLTRAFNALHADSLQNAEELFLKALKVRPEAPGNYVIHYNLGNISMSRNRYHEACERFSRALSLHSNLIDARFDRAVCYLELGNLTAAREDCAHLQQLADVSTEDRVRWDFLSAAIYMKGRQAHLAKGELEEILRLSPENRSAQLLLAQALEEMGQPQTALLRLNALVEQEPEFFDALLARAALESKLELPDLARADYDAALRLQPDAADVYVLRAKTQIVLGNKTAAARDLDRAVALGLSRGSLTPIYKQTE